MVTPKAILVDLRKCIGCRSCQVACKQWNELPGVPTVNRGTYENPPDLSSNTWTVTRFREIKENGRVKWFFSKLQCMHCVKPACVSVCPTEALHKHESGPVILCEERRCIGCQYCVMACPFSVPRFDWKTKIIAKCTMCVDRIENGFEPACVKTCPAGVLSFDERTVVVAKANEMEAKGAYIYGRDEVGGTSWIYISDVPFDQRGFPAVGTETYSWHSTIMTGSQLATMLVGAAALGVYSLYLRRKQMGKEE